MLNKKLTIILLIFIVFSFVFVAVAEEPTLEDIIREKMKNYEVDIEKNQKHYDRLVEKYGYSGYESDYGYFNEPYPIPFYDDYEKYNYGPDFLEYNYIVQLPVKYTNYYGGTRFKILEGKPLNRIQFGDKYKFIFKISSNFGIILTEKQLKQIYESEKTYSIEDLIELGDITYMNIFH
jgi:hypothetical protein